MPGRPDLAAERPCVTRCGIASVLPCACDVVESGAVKIIVCERCDSTGWVCEAHDDQPWISSAASRPCTCGAPGMPCPLCNQSDPPDTSRMGLRILLHGKGPRR